MCLLVLCHRVVEDAPIIVGANREEFYARGGEPPRILDGEVPVLAGVDPRAGGTWLGLNAHGLLAAVTNRPKSAVPPKPPSRGLLLRKLLNCPGTNEAIVEATRGLGVQHYDGCNILLADQNSAAVIHAGDWLRVRPLPPGIHVLTNRDVNDASDPRLGYALNWLSERGFENADECLGALRELCAQPGNGHPAMCLHGPDRGTVSSTLVILRESLRASRYLHAQGAPDKTPFTDYSDLLAQL